MGEEVGLVLREEGSLMVVAIVGLRKCMNLDELK
jgi:hypothetical protein